MEPWTDHVHVSRTARFFVLGDREIVPAAIVFVLHGYGMSARTFLDAFRDVFDPQVWVVAPEGLSRFYKKGFSGEVVASWMTREDRLSEIGDYKKYLDALYENLVPGPACRVMVLGFSQGAATASRWIMEGHSRVDELVLWGGDFAPEIAHIPPGAPRVRHVMASDDNFISRERMTAQTERMRSLGLEVVDHPFSGGHEIDRATLKLLARAMFP